MMARDWTYPDDARRDVGRFARAPSPRRDPELSYAAAVSMAYSGVASDIPDDMKRLLAKLN